ncbi:DUF3397 family protein [Lapidilactobacillus luobeiensis]|uniref:DUF3397 family protein n=1 Tax=Lapidilactobacillus luobeiensis TaxID=2950371 RepID=UPI0021C439D2|nr:DUF3397 family protein [Lapidilactobacillus luobeiensis]
MTAKLAMTLGLTLPWIAVILGLLIMILLRRWGDHRLRFYFLLPPVLTIATELLAESIKIPRTWAYSLIAVCTWALLYAVYLVYVKNDLVLREFFSKLWDFYLVIALIWYGFILIWVSSH